MKIYLLRHEDRTQDCSFFSPLTQDGLENSVKLIDRLKECKINRIFCSPFIRTLQTIYPYSKESNTNINIEYGLEEINHGDIIAPKNAGVHLPEYLATSFNHNSEYKSFIRPDMIVYPEKECHVEKRIKRFLRNLIIEYGNIDDNIILVTHQCVCLEILKIAKKNDIDYIKGMLSLVFDTNNGWLFEKI
jgi:broad specificity phosphatase PhoE